MFRDCLSFLWTVVFMHSVVSGVSSWDKNCQNMVSNVTSSTWSISSFGPPTLNCTCIGGPDSQSCPTWQIVQKPWNVVLLRNETHRNRHSCSSVIQFNVTSPSQIQEVSLSCNASYTLKNFVLKVNSTAPTQPNTGYQGQPNYGYQGQPNTGYQGQPNVVPPWSHGPQISQGATGPFCDNLLSQIHNPWSLKRLGPVYVNCTCLSGSQGSLCPKWRFLSGGEKVVILKNVTSQSYSACTNYLQFNITKSFTSPVINLRCDGGNLVKDFAISVTNSGSETWAFSSTVFLLEIVMSFLALRISLQ